jgi:hypothetical protein
MDITKQFKGTLPPGFRLEEEEDFLYLFYRKDRLVAVFSVTGVDPQEIEKEAKLFLEKHQK